MIGSFHKMKVSEFFTNIGLDSEKAIHKEFKVESTLFVGYNPGFGSGYYALLKSWCLDLT